MGTLKQVLRELQTGPFGSALHAADYVEGGIPVINPQHLKDGRIVHSRAVTVSEETASGLSAFRLQVGDIVLGRRGEMGRCAVVQPEQVGWILVTGSLALRCGQTSAPTFVAYHLRSPEVIRYLQGSSVGSTMMNLNQQILLALDCPLPPLPEQHRIVAAIEQHFSCLDAAVASLERVKVNLKRARASVLKAAVEGRLVPTEAALAKAEHRPFEPASVLLARILEERRRRWLESGKKGAYKEPVKPETAGLPALPEGWVWAALPQLGELGRGKSMHRPRNDSRLLGGDYPFIQTGDVRLANGWIRTWSSTYSDFGLAQSRLWPAGTLCITIAANIAETGILTFDACFPDSVVGFCNSDQGQVVKYIELFIRTAKERLTTFAPATAQKNINLETLSNLMVPLPPHSELTRLLEEIDRRLSVLDKIEASVELNLARCARLRQSILKRAFEGRLVKPEAPASLAASAPVVRTVGAEK